VAGRGPAPKPPELRRRYGQPARGEWVDLEPLVEPVLGPFNREEMTLRERMWNGWRNSPVTSQYGPEDIEAIYELARDYAEMTFADRDRRMSYLGLNPKGKRDLRWRTPNEVKTIKKAEAKANVMKLRAVEKTE
jgi:hypothetical protein